MVIKASFFSPVTPKDICRSSIPISYLTTTVESTDGQPHNVRFYSDVDGAWIAKDRNKTLVWDLHGQNRPANGTASSLYSWIVGQASPTLLSEDGDFPQWGNLSYTASSSGVNNFTYQSGYSNDVRTSFVLNHSLSNVLDTNYRGWGNNQPVFAFSHDVGSVSTASIRYTIGSIQTPIINYLTKSGTIQLQPWWQKCYGDMYALIDFHWNDFNSAQVLAAQFEQKLQDDVAAYYRGESSMSTNNHTRRDNQPYVFDPDNAYGYLDPNQDYSGIGVPGVSEAQGYYSIVALSARQVMGAYVYAVPPASSGSYTDVMMFQKEISSDGNVNTVDVLFPAMPYFLWANPEMLRYTLQGLFENQEAGLYPNGYSMHDLGSNFPQATGHVDGKDEYMPVEESGNMILMAYAYYKFASDQAAAAAWLSQHYALIRQWAQYLVEFSLVPEAQLSTDDFAGTLANQTNLAIKGIVGLQAMSAIANVTGKTDDVEQFGATAKAYYNMWETMAIDPSGKHTLLAYQWRSSWGMLYNIYPDRLLDLGIVSPAIYNMQSAWYPRVSQEFGIPLDNRHHYTKSDWLLWTAATCEPQTRRLMVTSLAAWLNSTATYGPFTDSYETVAYGDYPTTPGRILFMARPVVGGHFSLLALRTQ
jgi:hypothetical protein